MAADEGPQVPGVGLGDGAGAGQALQGRGGLLGHQKCLPGAIHSYTFLSLAASKYVLLLCLYFNTSHYFWHQKTRKKVPCIVHANLHNFHILSACP